MKTATQRILVFAAMLALRAGGVSWAEHVIAVTPPGETTRGGDGRPSGHDYQWDDGSSEQGIGSDDAEIVWIHHFNVVSGLATIESISTVWGSTVGSPGVMPGDLVRVYVWQDPNGDGNPQDRALLAEVSAVADAGSIGTDVFQKIPIGPVSVENSFFIGASVDCRPGGYPAPMDLSDPDDEAWILIDSVLYNMADSGYPCDWLLRADAAPPAAQQPLVWTCPEPLNSYAAEGWAGFFFFPPQVTTDGGGHWVAVWHSQYDVTGTIGGDNDIIVARSTDNGLTWTDSEPLNNNAATDSGSDFGPQLATDGAGHWVAVWHSDENLDGTIGWDGDILVACSTDGLTWTDPEPLNNNAATDSGDDWRSELATDAGGHWVAVWDSNENLGGTAGTDRDILVAHSSDHGLNWSDPQPLNNNAATDSGEDWYPQVTADGAGHWVAVWQSYDDLGGTIGTDWDILVACSTDGLTWADPEPLNNNAATDSGSDEDPRVATDGAGQWVAVWGSYNDLGGTIGTDRDILVARSTDNGVTWTDPEPLNNNAAADSGSDWRPELTTDGVGNWVGIWNSDEDLGGTIGTDWDILVARSSDNGLTWTDPEPLNNNATGSAWDWMAQVATDGAGHWVAAWISTDDLGGTIGTDPDILVARALWGDCNSNGIDDADDLASCDGSLWCSDCNTNAILDECDIAACISQDCNTNSVPDECDITAGTSQDCNTNGVPDQCDLAAGTSEDANSSGIPDECERVQTVRSCYAHSTAGEFCLEIGTSGTGPPRDNVEPRLQLGDPPELELHCSRNVSSNGASVSVSCTPSPFGGTATVIADGSDTPRVQFSGTLPDQSCCTLVFTGDIQDCRTIVMLEGDVNFDCAVTTADASSMKARLGDPLDESNFWYDVNRDGGISTADRSSVKARFENLAPCPCTCP